MRRFAIVLTAIAACTVLSRPVAGLALAERVACQRVIEGVYWAHRTWPDENPDPKPPLSVVLPQSALVARVELGLRASAALESVWNRPLTGVQLAAEIERMAANSRSPEMLRDVWAALGDDPVLVAECLARPLVADRLARSWYANEARIHGSLRRTAEDELDGVSRGLPPVTGRILRVERSKADLELDLRAAPGSLGAASWQDELGKLADSLGVPRSGLAELAGGGFGTLQEDEERFFAARLTTLAEDVFELEMIEWRKPPFEEWLVASGTPPEANRIIRYPDSLPLLGTTCEADSWAPVRYRPEARAGHATLWTGAEMVLWSRGDGHLYDPATDRWRPINRRGMPTDGWDGAVWTGTRMLVWGGGFLSDRFGGGGAYDPLTDTWTTLSSTGAPAARALHTAVWTGAEMIVWGGDGDPGAFADGARYNSENDTWTPISTSGAPAARHSHQAAWTGAEMIIWGGEVTGNLLVSGGRYDPASDVWTPTSLIGAPEARRFPASSWNGSRLLIWGGCVNGICSTPANTGALYDPVLDSWTATSTSGAPGGRRFHSAIRIDSEFMIWGGCTNHDCSQHTATGGLYDPATDQWTAIATVGAPSLRSLHSAVWTGTEVLIWGGCNSGECQTRLRSGGRYDPASDTWVPLDTAHAARRINHTAVWTGAEMIVWGGWDGFSLRSGGRYSPTFDAWLPMSSSPGGIDARDKHSAVWTGTEMIAWAGSAPSLGPTRSGGRYNPTSDVWTATAISTAPQARIAHDAFWTGTEMLVWGGCAFSTCSSLLDSGGFYDPATNSWRATSTIDVPSGRAFNASVWTGTEMIVWGGWNTSGQLSDGGRFDAMDNAWSPLFAAGAPTARQSPTAVWTGAEMIVWGGRNDSATFGDGARYSPAFDAWTPVSSVAAPAARYRHNAEWGGSEMIVYGGCEHFEGCWDRSAMGDGRRYDPATDSWSAPITIRFAAPSRKSSVSVWSGSEMIVWGGDEDAGVFATGGELDDGGRYCPGAESMIFQNGFESGDFATWSLVESP